MDHPLNSLDLDDVCARIGYTATRILAAWFGGQDLYVPPQYRTDHPLRLLIGESAFKALCEEFPGERLAVPSPSDDARYRRDRLVAELLARGASPGAIAQVVELTPRAVESLRVELVERGWIIYAGPEGKRPRGRPTSGTGYLDPVLAIGQPE